VNASLSHQLGERGSGCGVEDRVGDVVAAIYCSPLSVQIARIPGAERLEGDDSAFDRVFREHRKNFFDARLEEAVVAVFVQRVDNAVLAEAYSLAYELRVPEKGHAPRIHELDVEERVVLTHDWPNSFQHRRDFLVRDLALLRDQGLECRLVNVRRLQGIVHLAPSGCIFCLLVDVHVQQTGRRTSN